MGSEITQKQIDLLAETFNVQADACKTTSRAMTTSELSALMSGSLFSRISAQIHNAAAARMAKLAAEWAGNAMSAQSDPAKAAMLLGNYSPSKMVEIAQKEAQTMHKFQDRIERKITQEYRRRDNPAYFMALQEESSARRIAAHAWENAAEVWGWLREYV